ncbi:hypothetical protein L2E82_50409 [Cichorium intybus]|nr:hypothetical protein L2E82_50409 [Cichorium intybus]
MAETKPDVSLKDQGNEFFKAGNYLKAAAIYTQAIKKDPSNPTLYRSLLHLHGYFRKGCVLEAMERYDDALDA